MLARQGVTQGLRNLKDRNLDRVQVRTGLLIRIRTLFLGRNKLPASRLKFIPIPNLFLEMSK